MIKEAWNNQQVHIISAHILFKFSKKNFRVFISFFIIVFVVVMYFFLTNSYWVDSIFSRAEAKDGREGRILPSLPDPGTTYCKK